MMIAIKTIQTSFIPTKEASFHLQTRRLSNRKKSILCLSKANEASTDDPPPEGDTRAQDLLARILMIQTQKVRLTDYLDEKSAYLTQFAEEANAEIDKIGENALKGLDEAENRIMENLEKRMQAFEEAAEMESLELEKSDKELADFESQIEDDRNDGLFFKSLGQKTPKEKVNAEEETKKIKEITKDTASSKIRRNFYLAFMGLLVIALGDALISSSVNWGKFAILGVIFGAVFSQFFYEQKMSSDKEKD